MVTDWFEPFNILSITTGLLVGASVGALDGFRRPLGVQSPTFRLRLNMVLNQLTRRGSFFGNSAGVIGE